MGRSNQSTWNYNQPNLKEGKWILEGAMLADGRISSYGQFTVGQNLFLGYRPWDGLNFEDASIASDMLIIEELFTSLHVEEWETSLQTTPFGTDTFVTFSYIIIHQI